MQRIAQARATARSGKVDGIKNLSAVRSESSGFGAARFRPEARNIDRYMGRAHLDGLHVEAFHDGCRKRSEMFGNVQICFETFRSIPNQVK